MQFKRSIRRYGRTPEPETPFQRAGQMWDERIGSARVQARNWRLMAFGGLALSTGLFLVAYVAGGYRQAIECTGRISLPVGVAGHEGSTLLVTISGLRLLLQLRS